MKQLLIIPLLAALLCSTVRAQERESRETNAIQWMSWDEMIRAMEDEPRLIFIDTYTDWCGWCKQMDRTTFKDSVIINYMNTHYYAVKLDAEMKDTVRFDGHVFVNPNPQGRRSAHTLAASLLDNRLSYPSFVFLSPQFKRLHILPGYQKPQQLEQWLRYFPEGAARGLTLEEYLSDFESFYGQAPQP